MNGKPRGRKTMKKDARGKNNFQDEAEVREYDKGYRAGKFSDKRETRFKSNDPQWYFKDKNILNDVASYSFVTSLGTRLNNDRIIASTATNMNSAAFTAIPGLLSITIAPTPGISVDAQSPINLAAQNLYSFVRYKNSGAANYDPQDLMLYMLAMDSLYSMWNWAKRLYGFASTYSQMNKYEPRAYFAANNADIDDIYANLADFRAYLNMAANRISSFCVPASMTYIVRHSWLFANVYKDSNTRKAQQYMYVPAYFYQYDETSSANGGVLSAVNVCLNYRWSATTKPSFTFAAIKTMMDAAINALQYSEDIGIMSGDILKAYGEGGLFKLSTFEPDYKVEAVFSQEVLTQIENAMLIYDREVDDTSINITQDPNSNFIKFQPKLTVANNPRKGAYLNFHWAIQLLKM